MEDGIPRLFKVDTDKTSSTKAISSHGREDVTEEVCVSICPSVCAMCVAIRQYCSY